MTRIALFAGSFDPFTRGHEVVVEEALKLFDKVVIGVGENVSKRSLLSVEQRCRLIDDIYRDNDRVEVASYSTLTGDFAREVGATVLVRGVRNAVDFDFERTIEITNRQLFPTKRVGDFYYDYLPYNSKPNRIFLRINAYLCTLKSIKYGKAKRNQGF